MAQIAGLDDLRRTGPPEDIGTFVLPASIVIYQATFSGTTYVCAARAGVRGWVLVAYLPVGAANNLTVINAGIAALTAGRTWKERVVLIGNYTTNGSIAVLSYTVLEIYGKITATVAAYVLSIVNRTDVEIIGGYIDGANLTNSGVGISGAGSTRILVARMDIYNAAGYGVQISSQASEVIVSKCHINVYGDDGIAVNDSGTQKVIIEGNRIHGGTGVVSPTSASVEIGDHVDNVIIICNISYSNVGATACGININTHAGTPGPTNISIIGNWVYGHQANGINFTGVSGQINYYGTIMGNICYLNGGTGITLSYCENVTVEGNICRNNTSFGIRMTYCSRVTVESNSVRENGLEGIVVEAGSPKYIIVNANTTHLNQRDGIGVYSGSFILVTDNIVTNNSQRGAGTDDGIYVDAATDVLIDDNICTDDQGVKTQGHGIQIGSTANRVKVGTNLLTGNRDGCISDVGIATQLPTLTLPFVAGTGVVAAAGAPKGWLVDAANEYAITFGVMPPECQQSVRMKVWAVGLAAPGAGNEMLVDIEVNSGQPDETYNAEAISVTSKPNNETNFDVNDVISWTITATDDTDVDELLGGDCFEFKVIHRAAGAPDIATNALFRCVEIMFV